MNSNAIAQESLDRLQMDPLLETLGKIDTLIDVQLAGILVGLSLASASFMLTGRGQVNLELGQKQILLSNEQNVETCRKLEREILGLRKEQIDAQSGIQWLVKAHFLFVGNLISLLLFFDSFSPSSTTIAFRIIDVFGEGVPFFLGLAFLLAGAAHIRLVYLKP